MSMEDKKEGYAISNYIYKLFKDNDEEVVRREFLLKKRIT